MPQIPVRHKAQHDLLHACFTPADPPDLRRLNAQNQVCVGIIIMSDLLGDYLQAISRYPLLSPEEELHFGRLVRNWQDHKDADPDVCRRGRRALNRMVNGNLRLVVSVVKRYHDRIAMLNLEMTDLIQAEIGRAHV